MNHIQRILIFANKQTKRKLLEEIVVVDFKKQIQPMYKNE